MHSDASTVKRLIPSMITGHRHPPYRAATIDPSQTRISQRALWSSLVIMTPNSFADSRLTYSLNLILSSIVCLRFAVSPYYLQVPLVFVSLPRLILRICNLVIPWSLVPSRGSGSSLIRTGFGHWSLRRGSHGVFSQRFQTCLSTPILQYFPQRLRRHAWLNRPSPGSEIPFIPEKSTDHSAVYHFRPRKVDFSYEPDLWNPAPITTQPNGTIASIKSILSLPCTQHPPTHRPRSSRQRPEVRQTPPAFLTFTCHLPPATCHFLS
jgi:hypothetical protein